MLDYVYLQ